MTDNYTLGKKEITMLVESLECKIELLKNEIDHHYGINKNGNQYRRLRKELREYSELSRSLIKIISPD